MRGDFKSLTEVLRYTELRTILNVDKYSRYLLSMGDIFTPDRPGVYDYATGDCILNFDKGPGFWKDKRGNRREISNIADYDRAMGDVFDGTGRLAITARHHKTTKTDKERSLIVKARDTAASYVQYIMSQYHDNITLSTNMPDFEDQVYLDMIEGHPRKLASLRELESVIFREFSEMCNKYEWHEIWITKSSNTYLLDVKADIRIKEWYEDKFFKEMNSEQRRWENGGDQEIICT